MFIFRSSSFDYKHSSVYAALVCVCVCVRVCKCLVNVTLLCSVSKVSHFLTLQVFYACAG